MSQQKTFIILAREAIDGLTEEAAKNTYRTIKNNENSVWSNIDAAEKAFATKCDLNEQIEELEDEIEEDDAYQAKLDKLLSDPKTIKLISNLEKGFGVKAGSFAKISDSVVNIGKINKSPIKKLGDIFNKYAVTKLDESNDESDDDKQINSNGNTANNNLSETNIKNDSAADAPYDSDIATYQSVVYGNNQMVLAKKKKKRKKKKKKRVSSNKNDELMDDDLDDYSFCFEAKREHKVWDNPHDKKYKVIKADSSKEDKKREKIRKSNADIRRIKIKRKLSNANDPRKRNSSRANSKKKFKENAHEKTVKFKGTTSLKEKQRMEKVQKQREKIRQIKEKRKLEKAGKIKPKKTHSFAHAHDRY